MEKKEEKTIKINLEKTPLQLFSKRLVHIKHIQFIQDDLDKLDELDSLRKKFEKKNYLNQTYIIHLVSNWQVFIENLVQYAFEKIKKGNATEIDIDMLSGEIEVFKTPHAGNINKIFENVVGIKSITNNWSWGKMKKYKAKGKLDDILDIRHKIAHTGYSGEHLFIDKNFNYMKHLYNLAYILQYVIDERVYGDLEEMEIPYPENLF